MLAERTSFTRRNAAILSCYRIGERQADIAWRFGMTSSRVAQIIKRCEQTDRERVELVARYGDRPAISALLDDTSIDVPALMSVKIHGWRVRLSNLKCAHPAIATLGDLRDLSDVELMQISNLGMQLVSALHRYCPARLR